MAKTIHTTTEQKDTMTEPTRKPSLLFVCVENANRSQMAQAFATMLSQGAVDAFSAGSRPSGQVNPRAIQFMRELDYNLSTHESKSLDEFNGQQIDVAVTMGCGDACPAVKAGRREEWNIPDPKHLSDDEFRAIRDSIRDKVQTLIDSLTPPPA